MSDGAAGLQASDHDDDYSAAPGDLCFVCSWSARLRLGVCRMADGSLVFLHASKLGTQVSRRAVPVVRSQLCIADQAGGDVVSKVHTARLADSPVVCGSGEALLAAIVLTKHFAETDALAPGRPVGWFILISSLSWQRSHCRVLTLPASLPALCFLSLPR